VIFPTGFSLRETKTQLAHTLTILIDQK